MLLGNGISIDSDVAIDVMCQCLIRCEHVCTVASGSPKDTFSVYCVCPDKYLESKNTKTKTCDFCIIEKGSEHPSTCPNFKEGLGSLEIKYNASGTIVKLDTKKFNSDIGRLSWLYDKIIERFVEKNSQFLFGGNFSLRKLQKIYEICKIDIADKYLKDYIEVIEKIIKNEKTTIFANL